MKQDEIVDILKKEIAGMPDGARFHSTRILMQRFCAGQQKIVNVMERLINDNLVICNSGKGYFVHKSNQEKIPHYCFVMPVFPSEGIKLFDHGLKARAEASGKFRVTTIGIREHEHLIKNAMINHFDGIIILPPGGSINVKDVAIFTNLPKPVVIIDRDIGDIGISMVCSDFYSGGLKAAAHLIKNNHRKLAILITEPRGASIDMRCRGFIDFAKASGAEVEVIDSSVAPWESGSKIFTKLNDHIKHKGINFTGLFVISAPCVLEVYKCLADFGKKVPEDVSVIAHDHVSQNEYLQPPVTSIQASLNDIIDKLVDGLAKLSDGKVSLFQSRIEPEIIVRKSVKKL